MRTLEPRAASAQRAGQREWLALAVLMLPVLLVSIDNTVLSFALPAIALEFNTSGTTLLWIVDVYPLVLASLLIPMGSLGDRLGRRRMLTIGAAGFAALSVVAAFAPTAEALVAFRAGLGVFGSMIMPATLSLIRNLFGNGDQRRLAVAIWASMFSAGAALGPLIGGVLLQQFWWGSIFLLAIPVLVLMLALTPVFVPESKDPNPGVVDPWSVLLSIGAVLPVVYAIKNLAAGGALPATLASAVVGSLAGWLFVKRQLKRAQPMLDVRLFTVRPFTGAVLVNLLTIFSLVGFLYFAAQHLQLVLKLSPLEAGLVLLPGMVSMMAMGLLIVPLAGRMPVHVLACLALVCSATGYGLLAHWGAGATAGHLTVAFIIFAAGVGASETLSNDLILAKVPAAKAGAASAVSETAYELGSVLGIAVLGSVLVFYYRHNLGFVGGLTEAQASTAMESLGGAVSTANDLPPAAARDLLEAAHEAFGSGVMTASSIAACLLLAASVIAFRTIKSEAPSLGRKQ